MAITGEVRLKAAAPRTAVSPGPAPFTPGRFPAPPSHLPAKRSIPCRTSVKRPRRTLALCLGGIGDTVLSLAALRDLRRACPNDHLTALAMWPQSADLIRDLGIFDEVLQHNFQCDRWWRSFRAA